MSTASGLSTGCNNDDDDDDGAAVGVGGGGATAREGNEEGSGREGEGGGGRRGVAHDLGDAEEVSVGFAAVERPREDKEDDEGQEKGVRSGGEEGSGSLRRKLSSRLAELASLRKPKVGNLRRGRGEGRGGVYGRDWLFLQCGDALCW